MRAFEFYWDEDDDWGRHSYCDTFYFDSWEEAKQKRDRMIKDPEIYNVVFVEIGDDYDEDDRPM